MSDVFSDIKVRYFVASQKEMDICKDLLNAIISIPSHGSKPVILLDLVDETSVKEVQVSIAGNALVISGNFSGESYSFASMPGIQFTGFNHHKNGISFYISLPENVHGINTIAYEMEENT